MIAVEPYIPAHLHRLAAEGRQAHLLPLVEDETYAAALAQSGSNWTMLANGKPICVAGIYVPWGGRAIAHVLLAGNLGFSILGVLGVLSRLLEQAEHERIEAYVQTDRPECHRFARMLGFEREGTMRRFLAGDDFDCYARVRWS